MAHTLQSFVRKAMAFVNKKLFIKHFLIFRSFKEK